MPKGTIETFYFRPIALSRGKEAPLLFNERKLRSLPAHSVLMVASPHDIIGFEGQWISAGCTGGLDFTHLRSFVQENHFLGSDGLKSNRFAILGDLR